MKREGSVLDMGEIAKKLVPPGSLRSACHVF